VYTKFYEILKSFQKTVNQKVPRKLLAIPTKELILTVICSCCTPRITQITYTLRDCQVCYQGAVTIQGGDFLDSLQTQARTPLETGSTSVSLVSAFCECFKAPPITLLSSTWALKRGFTVTPTAGHSAPNAASSCRAGLTKPNPNTEKVYKPVPSSSTQVHILPIPLVGFANLAHMGA